MSDDHDWEMEADDELCREIFGESDLLLDVPETVPKWRELADSHEIRSWEDYDMHRNKTFYARHYAEPDSFGHETVTTISAPTEREAVITLIHRLQLDGWKEVSL